MTFRAKNQKSVLYYKCTLRENYFLGIFGVKTHYIIGHKKFKKVACIIKVELEKKDTISRVGGGHGFLLSASSASPLASALNAALTYRNADKKVIYDILHIHYYPLPTILPFFEPKFVP